MSHAGFNKESILLLKEHQGWKDTLSCPYFVIVNRIVGGNHAKRALALFKTSNRSLLFNHFIAESTGFYAPMAMASSLDSEAWMRSQRRTITVCFFASAVRHGQSCPCTGAFPKSEHDRCLIPKD